MEESLVFNQLVFARNQTLKALEGMSEDTAVCIPGGFNNHVLWNAGHIYLVLERFAFHYAELPVNLPQNFAELFGNGTSPRQWREAGPSLDELRHMLRNQLDRVQSSLKGRLAEPAKEPYTTSAGMSLSTIGEFVNFTSYHEAMHFSVIKMYKKILMK